LEGTKAMQIVIIDEDGYLQTLVGKIKGRGYDVQYYPRWNASVAKMKPDVLLANTLKPLRHLDHILVGITQPVFNMITDKEYMRKVMKVWGVVMPITHTPKDFKPEKGKRYCINCPSLPTYYSEAEDAKTVVEMLLHHKLEVSIEETPYNFEIEVEAWFNGKKFLSPPYFIIDEMIMHPLPRTLLYGSTLEKIEGCLKKLTFRGPISMGVGVGEDGIYVLSLDCKFRPMVFEAMEHVEEYLRAVVTGANAPMYPEWVEQTPIVSNVSRMLKLPVGGMNDQNKKHLWLNGKDVAITGINPTLGYITARGGSVRECNRRITRTRENITIPYTLPHPLARHVKEKEKMLREWGLV